MLSWHIQYTPLKKSTSVTSVVGFSKWWILQPVLQTELIKQKIQYSTFTDTLCSMKKLGHRCFVLVEMSV